MGNRPVGKSCRSSGSGQSSKHVGSIFCVVCQMGQLCHSLWFSCAPNAVRAMPTHSRTRVQYSICLNCKPTFSYHVGGVNYLPTFHSLSHINLRPATTTATTSSSASAAPSTPAASICSLLASLVLGLHRVVNEKGVEGKRVGENEVANGGSSDIHSIQGDGILATLGHLHRSQGGVH